MENGKLVDSASNEADKYAFSIYFLEKRWKN